MDHTARRQLATQELRESWLREVTWLEEVDSTNSLARRRLLAGNLQLPGLIVADRQTAGRGRQARSWYSPTGCLMLSLVIDSSLIPSEPLTWPQLSLVSGVAAAKAAEQLAPDVAVKLKWPNDLYIGQSKLAGILVEAVPLGQSSTSQFAFIVGIGLNVAVDFSSAPAEVGQRACSLNQFTRQPLYVESMLVHLVDQLHEQLNSWREHEHTGDQEWWHEWSQRSLLTGRAVQAQQAPGQVLSGYCEGIDPQGCLILRSATGVYHLQSADIVGWE